METQFDLTVIGSGPGGYACAIRAAQLGFKTAVIEKYDEPGGTCTNVGCIPSKALLDSTEHYATALHKFKQHGIEIQEMQINFAQLMRRKAEVVKQNTNGLLYLFKKNKISLIRGRARFTGRHGLEVITGDQRQEISSRYIVIATGSKPASIKGIVPDKKRIITSTEALSLQLLPQSMVIIGGGVIGAELASVYARLGTKITLVEYADRLIPQMDAELGNELEKILSKAGVNILKKHTVRSATNNGTRVILNYLNGQQQEKQLEADYCLVATGRKPYTEGLGLENTGIDTDAAGRIITNAHKQTAVSHIYAIGDVSEGMMLAHKAEEEGIMVAELLAGIKHDLNYRLIPSVVYTWPEIASVGYTEEQLKTRNISYRKGRFPFLASGRARAALENQGFVKILSDPVYGEVLGVHIVGPRAADLIGQAVTAMHYETTDEDLCRISYAHPTYSEAIKEAARMAAGTGAINI